MKNLTVRTITLMIIILSMGLSFAYCADGKYLSSGSSSDGKGLSLSYKNGSGAKFDLYFVDRKGNTKGKLTDSQVKISDKNFVEVSPSGEAIEVRLKARFAFIPEFYGFDALFDPTLSKNDLLYIASENFLIAVQEGGKAGVMFVWPSGGNQIPMLVAEGKGENRRFTKMRVTFDKKPVYVAVFDHKDGFFSYITGLDKKELSYDKKVKHTRTYKYAEVKSGWKFPYDAMWWTILTKPDDNRTCGMPSWSIMVTKSTFSWNDIQDVYRKPSSKHGDGQWVLELEERYKPQFSALVYPRTRVSRIDKNVPFTKTPDDVFTVTDVIFSTLGKDAYDKVIGREGVKSRGCAPKGEPLVWATCAGSWELWCAAGCDCSNIRKGDRGKPNKDSFYKRSQALMHFVDYGVKRIKEYRDMAKDVIKLCEKEGRKNAGLKDSAGKMIKYSEEIEKLWEKEDHHYNKAVNEKREKYKKDDPSISPWSYLTDEEAKNISMASPGVMEKLRDWCRNLFDKYAEKDQPSLAKMYGKTRMQWTEGGGRMDGILVFSRKNAQIMRQQAALIFVDSPETRQVGLEIRQKVLDTLKYFHYKEELPRPQFTAQLLGSWKARTLTSH